MLVSPESSFSVHPWVSALPQETIFKYLLNGCG
jgi:hypothetical protein